MLASPPEAALLEGQCHEPRLDRLQGEIVLIALLVLPRLALLGQPDQGVHADPVAM